MSVSLTKLMLHTGDDVLLILSIQPCAIFELLTIFSAITVKMQVPSPSTWVNCSALSCTVFLSVVFMSDKLVINPTCRSG